MEAGTIVSLVAGVLSLVALINTMRKDTRSDAAQNAIISTKLDSVKNGVDDIRVEIRTMRDNVADHGERIAKLEAAILTKKA